MLFVNALHKSYGRNTAGFIAIRKLDLVVHAGEFFTLVGPSGCGKTTALRCIAGLETPSGGEIRIAEEVVYAQDRGVCVPANLRDVAMVFQSYAIWPHLSVGDNVGFPLDVKGVRGKERDMRVDKALEMVGLSALRSRPASNLSGGQQQRVSLARAIIKRAKLLLLDEPLSNLDAELRVQMRGELRNLQQTLGVTSIYVTHDQEEALSMSDRIAVLNHGDVVEQGTPRDLYYRPRQSFTATFLGLTHLLECRPVEGAGPPLVETPIGLVLCDSDGARPAGALKLAVRPEHIEIADGHSCWRDSPNVFRGKVAAASFAGRYVDYRIGIANQLVAAQATSGRYHEVGGDVSIRIDPRHCILVGD